jgi:ABC-type multidrug transport system ATPase subunit
MLPYADRLIILDKGRMIDSGPPREMIENHPQLTSQSSSYSNADSTLTSRSVQSESKMDQSKLIADVTDAEETTTDGLYRQSGSWHVYQFYIKSSGYLLLMIFIFLLLSSALSSNFAGERLLLSPHPQFEVGPC